MANFGLCAQGKLIMYSKKHNQGASMVEYAILVAIIAVAAVAGITSFGDKVKSAFDTVGTKVTTETSK